MEKTFLEKTFLNKINLHKQKLPAFTLIELSIVLVIIGIMMGAAFKGKDLLESAKINSILEDAQKYRMAVTNYQEHFHALPGDDPKASDHFGSDVTSGNGDGKVTDNESSLFWIHLFKAGYINASTPPTSKMGGQYTVFSDNDGLWLVLGKASGDNNFKGPLLTPLQARQLKTKSGDHQLDLNSGDIRIQGGNGAESGACIQNNRLNLDNKNPACIGLLKIN
jgi:prepilin-type N-terminal cleavage/methylation domain-containing protein